MKYVIIFQDIYRNISKKGTLSLYNDNIGHLMGALNVCVGDDTLSKHQHFYYTKGYLLSQTHNAVCRNRKEKKWYFNNQNL